MKKLLFLLVLIQFAGTARSEVQQSVRYDKIKIESLPQLIINRDMENDPEAIALSPDGSRLAWIDKKRSSSRLQAVNMFMSVKVDNEFKKYLRIRKSSIGDLYTGISFTPANKVVASEENYKFGAITSTLTFMAFSNEDPAPKGYESCIKVNFKARDQKKLCVEDFGLLAGDFLQHPRISPNGKYLVIYIKGNQEGNKPGVYLYDLEDTTSGYIGFHAGVYADKHPTWSPDGSKILFHHQTGGNTKDGSSLEKAVIGYYEINYNTSNPLGRRFLMDDINQEGYVYHKHPAVIPNTNILIFHGQNEVDGNKKLYARKLTPGSKVFQLKIPATESDLKMYKAKHPATSYQTKEIYFIGKEKEIQGEDGKEALKGPKQIYRLGPEAVQQIENAVNGVAS
jgi:hypothetical protein